MTQTNKIWGLGGLARNKINIGCDDVSINAGDLIVISGCASAGKTLLSIELAYELASLKSKKVLYIFSKVVSLDRINCQHENLKFKSITGITVERIEWFLDNVKGTDVLIIDSAYDLHNAKTEQSSLEICQRLKDIAKDRNIAIITTAPISWKKLDNPYKKPELCDLETEKCGKVLIQNADTFIMLGIELLATDEKQINIFEKKRI